MRDLGILRANWRFGVFFALKSRHFECFCQVLSAFLIKNRAFLSCFGRQNAVQAVTCRKLRTCAIFFLWRGIWGREKMRSFDRDQRF